MTSISTIASKLRELADTLDGLEIADSTKFVSVRFEAQVSGANDADVQFEVLSAVAAHFGCDLALSVYNNSRGVPALHVTAQHAPDWGSDDLAVKFYGGFDTDEPLPRGISAVPATTLFRLTTPAPACEAVPS